MGKKITFHFSLFVYLIITSVNGQNNSKIEQFNLPPKTVFQEKSFQKIDYSEKLNSNVLNKEKASNFLKKFTIEEWEYLEKLKNDEYYYYLNANKYFVSLSDKVKYIYTVDELWYIYMFDIKLTEKLLSIK